MDLILLNSSVAEGTADCNDSSTEALSSSAQVERVFKTVFLVLLAIANILGNLSVCFVVLKDRHLRSTVRNYAVASLAVADLLAVQIITFHIFTYYDVGKQSDICQIMGKIYGSLLYVSILHLCVLSLDRYVAIFYPLHYRFMVTPRRTVIILATVWFVPIFSIIVLPALEIRLHGFASFYGCYQVGYIEISTFRDKLHMYLNATILFFVPLFVMLAAYFRISKIAWYQANRVGIALVSVVRTTQCPRPLLPRAREKKWAKTLAIVIGTFIFCYLPIVVASMLHVRGGFTRGTSSLQEALGLLLFPTYLNTVLNPVIYSHRSNEYRRAFKKVFVRCCCRESTNPLSPSQSVRRESQNASSYMTSST